MRLAQGSHDVPTDQCGSKTVGTTKRRKGRGNRSVVPSGQAGGCLCCKERKFNTRSFLSSVSQPALLKGRLTCRLLTAMPGMCSLSAYRGSRAFPLWDEILKFECVL